ncbi:MAG: mandelate racemase/muconate lactonizing enzyme family protein, partial [Lachnospiraceae bacterium]|nr:mandelate racemase/muconate lactonizing enzyme family protein [Lachnospiraceae bacterium]
MAENYESTLQYVRQSSKPTDLRITDMKFVDIVGAPMHCILLKLETNQGLVGYGEVRDGGDKIYAQMLKGLILGENPCNIDLLFRRIKQFGGYAR